MNKTAISKRRADGAALAGGGGESNRGLAGEFGPAAAREVGNGQQRFPDVSGAVGEAGRNGRVGGSNGGGVVESESGALALEV